MKNADQISLRSITRRYVVAEKNGKANANRFRMAAWEKFTVELHPAIETQAGPEDGEENNGTNTTQHCNLMSIGACTLPFPSNEYTVSDKNSPTGLKIDLKGSLFSKAVEDSIIGFSSRDMYQGRNGFSAAAPISFELPGQIDKDSIPLDGGDAFIVFNKNTGQRVPINVDINAIANDGDRFLKASDGQPLVNSRSHVIQAYPRSRFAYNSTFVAVITKSLKRSDGTDFPASNAIQSLTTKSASSNAEKMLSNALNYAELNGISKSEIISITEFTTIDEVSSNGGF